ncbi:hypothetical protein B4U80_04356 [Leptotrombidium deliense]|uniref:DUF1279 domain-containing protein n=1 Tax=Leptotrombidium deliense TaxID=299467 RepID=A0A443S853_9ACAR|nr:hypothetical protein B4U80_04356 [Leptotrombidium deliense]
MSMCTFLRLTRRCCIFGFDKHFSAQRRLFSKWTPVLMVENKTATNSETLSHKSEASEAEAKKSSEALKGRKITQSGASAEPSKVERLKLAVRDYGVTVVVFHVIISIASLAICYFVVSIGLPVEAVIEKLSISKNFVHHAAAGGAFVVAYVLHKCFAPVRMACTLFCAPPLVRYLRARGILTPSKIMPPMRKTK